MYRLIQVIYACSVRRLRCLKRATSLTCSRSLRSGMVKHYIGSCGLMIDSDAYLIVRCYPFVPALVMTRRLLLRLVLAIAATVTLSCGGAKTNSNSLDYSKRLVHDAKT